MNITISEISKERSRLRREVMERRCVLAALDIMHEHVAGGELVPASTLGDLVLNLAPAGQPRECEEVTESAAAPEPPALPSPPPVERYMHPELKAFGNQTAATCCVRWAVSQMTRNFSLHHLSALLEREGRPLATAQISVVLSRLKARGEIEQIRPGMGPLPALFRRPDIARPADFKPLDVDLKLPPPPYQSFRGMPYGIPALEEYRTDEGNAPADGQSIA